MMKDPHRAFLHYLLASHKASHWCTLMVDVVNNCLLAHFMHQPMQYAFMKTNREGVSRINVSYFNDTICLTTLSGNAPLRYPDRVLTTDYVLSWLHHKRAPFDSFAAMSQKRNMWSNLPMVIFLANLNHSSSHVMTYCIYIWLSDNWRCLLHFHLRLYPQWHCTLRQL